jgi:hypothetical protein
LWWLLRTLLHLQLLLLLLCEETGDIVLLSL